MLGLPPDLYDLEVAPDLTAPPADPAEPALIELWVRPIRLPVDLRDADVVLPERSLPLVEFLQPEPAGGELD
jgi:hypothetical protein